MYSEAGQLGQYVRGRVGYSLVAAKQSSSTSHPAAKQCRQRRPCPEPVQPAPIWSWVTAHAAGDEASPSAGVDAVEDRSFVGPCNRLCRRAWIGRKPASAAVTDSGSGCRPQRSGG